jgi:dTDP-L-rhamnose 4-epimerase
MRDFVNIDDVVDANLIVLDNKEADYHVFNVGGGKAYTILEFADVVRKVFGKEILPRIPGEYRFGDTRHIISDISMLKTLGWKPKYSPAKSVKDYAGWLMEQEHPEDVLESAEQKMRQMNVVRKSKGFKEAL